MSGSESSIAASAQRVITSVVAQHVEDAAVLRNVRSVLVRSPHVQLHRLARLDERLSAHLDGALEAGDDGFRLALAELGAPSAGQVFVVAALAIEQRNEAQIEKLVALTQALPTEAPRALSSALGWVSTERFRNLTTSLLRSGDPLKQRLSIAACAAHPADPGPAMITALASPDAQLRTTAIRAAARLGRIDVLQALLSHLRSDEPTTRAAAAWASVLLGARSQAAQALRALAIAPDGTTNLAALHLHLLSTDPDVARNTVRELVTGGAPLRTAIRAAAWAGDLQVVPWLIKHMADEAHARVAGEAFTFLTGADLALLDLELKDGGQTSSGPNDAPQDTNVALDEDESLPWPDVDRVKAWWERHRASMPTAGRCFMGGPPTPEHCTQVLRTGGQRQRYAAALLLALMKPGSVLFNVAAPAWRQQRALGLPARVT